MSNYPPSASKLLSTLSSASSSSSDHQNLSKRSCTGVFYQLFDWNRRLHKKHPFRHKSLPAERLASPPMKESVCGDEKLPSSPMLIVADENKGESKQAKAGEDATLPKDQTPEKKRKKRSPNVVAKLMGLETMPSPDLCREKWSMHPEGQASVQSFKGKSLFSDPKVPSSRRSLASFDGETSSSRRDFGAKVSLQGAVATRNNRNRECEERDGDVLVSTEQTPGLPTKVHGTTLPGQRNRPLECILSPSNAHNRMYTPIKSPLSSGHHNKMYSPIKSPLSSKAKVCLFEAASKVLEPGTHPRNTQIKPMGSRHVSFTYKNEHEKENNDKVSQREVKSEHVSSRLYPADICGSKQEDKNSSSALTLRASRSRGPAPSSSSHVAISREETTSRQLKRGKTGNEDKDNAKFCHGQGHIRCLTSQEQGLVRRTNDAAREKAQTFTPEPTTSDERKDPNVLRTRKKLADNDEPRSNLCDRSTPSTITCNRRGSMNASFSRNKGKPDSGLTTQEKDSRFKREKTHTRLDPLPIKKDLSAKSVRTKTSEQESKSGSGESSISKRQSVSDGSTSGLQQGELLNDVNGYLNEDNLSSNDEHSLEAPSLRVQHQDEDTSNDCIVECDGIDPRDIGVPTVAKDLRQGSGIIHTYNDSSCSSITEEVRDTASSVDICGHKRKQMVSYSGKSTATILQELLLALNPSGQSVEKMESSQADSCLSGLTTTTTTAVDAATAVTVITGSTMDATADSSRGDDHDCCTISVEDSAWMANPNRHTLEECRDECWQLSPTSSLVSSFHNERSDCSESPEDMQDGQSTRLGCWDRLTIGRNRNLFNSRQLKKAGVLNQTTENLLHSEEGYVKCILDKAHISTDGILSVKLQIRDSIIDAPLFDKIEAITMHDWAFGTKVGTNKNELNNPNNHLFVSDQDMAGGYVEHLDFPDEEMARGYRKLVFDSVDEALRAEVGVGELQAQVPYLHLPLEARCNRVLRHVHDWQGMRCGMNVDDMVEKEMNTGLGKWADFCSELYDVGAELESSVVTDLIDELVWDLISVCRQRMPIVKVANVAKTGGLERKRLVWVGL